MYVVFQKMSETKKQIRIKKSNRKKNLIRQSIHVTIIKNHFSKKKNCQNS